MSTSLKLKPVLKIIGLTVGIGLLFIGVQWAVKTFKNPNQMGIIESMSMKMEIQVPEGAMPVTLETVKPSAFSSSVTYTGTVDAYNDIPIFPRVEGWVVEAPVYSGDQVKKGQVLARLDTQELHSRYQRAQSQKQTSQNAIQAAQANLDYWKSEIKRSESLVKEDVITQEEYERERSQYETARSKYEQALSSYESASAAALTEGITLSYATIKAPLNGVITERKLDEGVLVKPNMEILRLAQLSPIRVQAEVAEADFDKIQVGQPVQIWKGLNTEGSAINAKVTSVFPSKDPTTRTALVEALIPNKDRQFVPGDFVTVNIHVGQNDDAITVAKEAVIEKDHEQAVWVVQNKRAKLRYVSTGGRDEKRIQIISGLKAGEQVVVLGNQDLLEAALVVAADFDSAGELKRLPKADTGTRLTADNQYKVKQSLKHVILTASLKGDSVIVGKNEIRLQLTSMHGNLPKDIEIEARSFMPSMPKMRVPQPSIRKVKGKSGEFYLNTDLIMSGLWQLELTIKEGSKTLASTQIQLEAAE